MMQRMGWVTTLRPEAIEIYRRLHAEVWPGVLSMISACNIRNYSIFLREPENLLFGVFDYVGADFEADQARMAQDPKTQEWWALTGPCQAPLESAAGNETWAPMERVFHYD